MKKIVIVIMALVLFAGCSANPLQGKEIEIVNPTGDNEIIDLSELDYETFTDEQIEALISVADGENGLNYIIQSDIFDKDTLGLLDFSATNRGFGNMPEGTKGTNGMDMDFDGMDIDDLNLDGLTSEQIDAVEKLISGDMTFEEFNESGVLTPEQLMGIGLFGDAENRGLGQKGNVKP